MAEFTYCVLSAETNKRFIHFHSPSIRFTDRDVHERKFVRTVSSKHYERLPFASFPLIHSLVIILSLYLLTFTFCRGVVKGYSWKGSIRIQIQGKIMRIQPITFITYIQAEGGTRYRSWVRHYTTNRKVACYIPDEVIEFFS
jgi:hypothetical protein